MLSTILTLCKNRQFWIGLCWIGLLTLLSLAINLYTYSFERGMGLNTIALNLLLAFFLYQLLIFHKPLWAQIVFRGVLSIFIVLTGCVLIFIGAYHAVFEHNIPVGVLLQTIQTNSAEAKEALEQFVTLKAIIYTVLIACGLITLLTLTWMIKTSTIQKKHPNNP